MTSSSTASTKMQAKGPAMPVKSSGRYNHGGKSGRTGRPELSVPVESPSPAKSREIFRALCASRLNGTGTPMEPGVLPSPAKKEPASSKEPAQAEFSAFFGKRGQ